MICKTIVPDGWPCTLEECPPGPFVSVEYPNSLCFKSEYRTPDGRVESYCESGEFFCGKGLVQPVEMIVKEVE